MITLEEARDYLRQSSHDDDDLIEGLIRTAEKIVMDTARIDEEGLEKNSDTTYGACLYTLAYLYEHREEADHHALTLDLRSLLFGVREAAF